MINNISFDTMIAHHAILSEKGVPHDLAFIGSTYTPIPFYKDDVKGEDNFALLPDSTLRTYNCRDCLVVGLAAPILDQEIDEYGVRKIFKQDMAMIRPILRMQEKGVLINKTLLEKKRKELDEKVIESEADLKKILGSRFNPGSNAHVADLLFKDLNLIPIAKTRTGLPKVDFDSIVQLADQVSGAIEPLFHTIIDFRRAKKKLKTYYKEFILDHSGRVHSQFLIHVTPTGRLSSRSPNLQNFPESDREIFIPRPGYIFISRDYNQIEIRILAIITNDKKILHLFSIGEDIHTYNAIELFSILRSQVKETHRHIAKTFMYGGVIYGGTAATIRRQILSYALQSGNVSMNEVPSIKQIENSQNNWFINHPNIVSYQRSIEKEVLQTRKITTPLGRVRYFLGRREDIVREAYNTPIQGTASDIINPAFIELDKIIREPAGIVIQCHDELLFEVPINMKDEVIELSKVVMEKPIEINGQKHVFPTSCKVGYSWKTLEKI